MAFGDIVLLKDHRPHGPYTRAQIQEGLGRGEFTGRDLAHTPGLRDWLPLLEVLHHLDRETVNVPRPRAMSILPPLPGQAATRPGADAPRPGIMPVHSAPMFPAVPAPAPPAFPPPLFSPVGSKAEVTNSSPVIPPLPPCGREQAAEASASSKPPLLPRIDRDLRRLVPAPLGQRLSAWLIDWGVLFVPVLVVFAFSYGAWWVKGPLEHRDPETTRQEQALLWRNLRELMLLVAIGFAWIYAAGLESSRWQATVGKQCMGLIVSDARGERLSFARATGRHAAKYLSAVPLFLGFIAALFDRDRLTWHDRLAGTRVIRR